MIKGRDKERGLAPPPPVTRSLSQLPFPAPRWPPRANWLMFGTTDHRYQFVIYKQISRYSLLTIGLPGSVKSLS